MKDNLSEKNGQILVILAVAIVGLIMAAALAVDGGLVYVDRRTAQTVADSSALAGAGAAAQIIKDFPPIDFYCGASIANNAIDAAEAAAVNNGSMNDQELVASTTEPSRVEVICDVDDYSSYIDIIVTVTTQTDLKFGHILHPQPIISIVDTNVRVYPKRPLAFGNGITSLSNSCGNIGGIVANGSGDIRIVGGGIFTNSCLKSIGSMDIFAIGAPIQYFTTYSGTGSTLWDLDPDNPPAPQGPIKADKQLPSINFNPTWPSCSGLTNYGSYSTNSVVTTPLQPGIYTQIKVGGSGSLTLSPGLYCMDGDISVSGGASLSFSNTTFYFRDGEFDLSGTGNMTGNNVTFFMGKNSDGWAVNGTGQISITAPNCETSLCGVGPSIRGMLLVMESTNNSDISYTGTIDAEFMGTIYAPNGRVVVSGSSTVDTIINTQIIAKRVDFNGSGTIEINLSGAEIYQDASSIDIVE
jgi:hypothetical protein